MKVSALKENPDNPRKIDPVKLEKLINSIHEFPAMMELRPIVVDSDNVVLGGNMRLKVLIELGYKEIPDTWVKRATDLTDEEKQRFIIADNVGFGDWDWQALQEGWDVGDLGEWGLDVPTLQDIETSESVEYDKSDFNKSADSYLNAALRQIVLVYDIDTHKKTLEDLADIGKIYDTEDNNSATVLKLVEFYKTQHNAAN
jgi:ParB-like chromosome segregation protein Spo0J